MLKQTTIQYQKVNWKLRRLYVITDGQIVDAKEFPFWQKRRYIKDTQNHFFPTGVCKIISQWEGFHA